ncbi:MULTISPECIES: ABC transporter permease subunit [Clostridium]|uniref:ABC transporter permease subunit n=1 Tax=Clostridium TaxID=1485 RepID=UPI000824D968|nr:MULTISPECIES: ABC transporter permease subunit [Clostridium]PJI07559.1 ABC transporter permease [Clostridium sp. CT7]
MYNLIKADLFKLRKSKAIKIIFAITVISALTMTIMAYLIQKGKLNTGTTGIGFLFSDANMMGILGAVLAGVFICGDFDNRTIHEAIVNGNSRCQVVISKAIVFFISCLVILLPYFIATGIAIETGYKFNMGGVSVGFLNLITTEGGKAISLLQGFKILAIMFALVFIYIAQLGLCIPFAIVFKKPVVVVAVYYGITILFSQMSKLEASAKTFKNIIECTPYGSKYVFMALNTGAGDIARAFIVSLICIIIMIAITCYAFRRAEIK